MAPYRVHNNCRIEWEDSVYEGFVTGIQINQRDGDMPRGRVDLVGITTTCSADFTEEKASKKKRLSKDDLAWQKVRTMVERDCVKGYVSSGGKRYLIQEVDSFDKANGEKPKENEMRIYKLNVVNRRTREYKEFVIPVFAPNGSDAIKQGLLVNAEAINRMGDTSEIEVWVDEKWKFEPIDEKSD